MLSSFFLKKSSRNICRFKKKPYLCIAIEKQSNSEKSRRVSIGGIGRRAGLKHQWIHFHPGSTPGLGT